MPVFSGSSKMDYYSVGQTCKKLKDSSIMLRACLFTGLQCVAKCGVTNRAWERHFLLSTRFKNVTADSALKSAGGCTYIHITHTYAYTYSYVHICMHTHTPRLIYTCSCIWIIASRVICYCFHVCGNNSLYIVIALMISPVCWVYCRGGRNVFFIPW